MIINEKYFKQYSPIPLNYNMAEIKNYIPVSEKIWVIPVIGQTLYDEIDYQVKNDAVSEENATLLTEGGLWQYLSFATVLEALPLVWASITEVGVTKGKSDNSESLTLKDMTYVSQHLRQQVEVLKDQVIKWLCERQEHFPLLDTCICDCNNSCCGSNSKLNSPSPMWLLYSPPKKNTDLR